MKFRDQEVSGFFVVHSRADGVLLSKLIRDRLDLHKADMLDVQYSTHIQNGQVYNDVLVMYTDRKKAPGGTVL